MSCLISCYPISCIYIVVYVNAILMLLTSHTQLRHIVGHHRVFDAVGVLEVLRRFKERENSI
jgi:hypothetical protein